jgi:PAS domain S-box-containing protein
VLDALVLAQRIPSKLGCLRRLELTDSVTDLGGLGVGAEDFLAAVLRTIAQPVWVVDPEGLIRFANPAAVAALGYDNPDELIGRNSHNTIHYRHPDGRPYPASECPMLLPRTSGATIARDLDWFFRRDGSIFPVSYVSVPIEMSRGRGAVVAFNDIESRLRAEEELRERDVRLAEEQSSLRRLAALVAGGADSVEVFAAMAREVAHVLSLPLVEMSRYEPDGTTTVIGVWSQPGHSFQNGTPWRLAARTLATLVLRTASPTRIDDSAGVADSIAEAARDIDIRCGAGRHRRHWGASVSARYELAGGWPEPDRACSTHAASGSDRRLCRCVREDWLRCARGGRPRRCGSPGCRGWSGVGRGFSWRRPLSPAAAQSRGPAQPVHGAPCDRNRECPGEGRVAPARG